MEKGENEREWIYRQAVLGGIHAIRNIFQVVKTYLSREELKRPGKDAVKASLDRTMNVLEALECLLFLEGDGLDQYVPLPPEGFIELMPELFVYKLREKGASLEIKGNGRLSKEFYSPRFYYLMCLLFLHLVENPPPGRKTIRISVRENQVGLSWKPEKGVLPFRFPPEGVPERIKDLAIDIGLSVTQKKDGIGFEIESLKNEFDE